MFLHQGAGGREIHNCFNYFMKMFLFFPYEIDNSSNRLCFGLNDSCFLGDVETIQELTDILVLHGSGVLDMGS
jgi:hypothetical protein